MSEPTKAAMRAADKVWDEASDYDWHRKPPDLRIFEMIIDRETGLPELIAALRWYVDNDDTIEMSDNGYWLDGRNRAKEALRKAGEL